MGFLFLSVSVFFSLSVAQVLKLTESKPVRTLNILVINYLTAVLISFFSTEWTGFENNPALVPVMMHAAVLGFFFILNFLIYSRSIDKNGMGVSIAAMRMSLVFPILLSLIFYNESASPGIIIGIILSLIALILLIPTLQKKGDKQLKYVVLPVMLFFISGITDSGLKVFEEEFSAFFNESQFLTGLFFFAFLTGLLVLAAKREFNFKPKELLYGILLGVVNLYSSFFLLLSLKDLPGSLVFPLTNLGVVFLGTLVGILLWKDHPEKKQWIGLALASISIMLLVV